MVAQHKFEGIFVTLGKLPDTMETHDRPENLRLSAAANRISEALKSPRRAFTSSRAALSRDYVLIMDSALRAQ